MNYSNKMLTKSLQELADLEQSRLVEGVAQPPVSGPVEDSQEIFTEMLEAIKQIDERRGLVRDVNVGLY
jgi:hypothetical protein